MFLARQSYRRRRVIDASRLAPIVGGLLFLLPMLWGAADDSGASLARRTLVLFVIWGALVILAAVVASRLGSSGASDFDLPQERSAPEPRD